MNLDVEPADSAHYISEDLWFNVIHPEVLAQCDGLDGVCSLFEPDTFVMNSTYTIAGRRNHR